MEPVKVDLETAKMSNAALRVKICERLDVDPASAEKTRDFLLSVTQRLKDWGVGGQGGQIEKVAP